MDSPCGTVYLCALIGSGSSGLRRQFTEKGGKCFFSMCQTARRADAVRWAPRSPYRAEHRETLGNKVLVAKRGPGALRTLLHKLGLSWLWWGRVLAGGCRGPFALNTPTGRAATSRAAHHQPGADVIYRRVCGQRSVLGGEWTLASQTQHRTFIILICLVNDSYVRAARTVLIIHYRCWRIVLIYAVSMQPGNYADSFIYQRTRRRAWVNMTLPKQDKKYARAFALIYFGPHTDSGNCL